MESNNSGPPDAELTDAKTETLTPLAISITIRRLDLCVSGVDKPTAPLHASAAAALRQQRAEIAELRAAVRAFADDPVALAEVGSGRHMAVIERAMKERP